MARDKKFVFRLSGDESSRLAQLAWQAQRTQSDVIRCLIRTADTQQQKNPPTTQSWPADVVGGLDNRSHLETNSHAKDTTRARD